VSLESLDAAVATPENSPPRTERFAFAVEIGSRSPRGKAAVFGRKVRVVT
jgi:hypothetical protein